METRVMENLKKEAEEVRHCFSGLLLSNSNIIDYLEKYLKIVEAILENKVLLTNEDLTKYYYYISEIYYALVVYHKQFYRRDMALGIIYQAIILAKDKGLDTSSLAGWLNEIKTISE